jgi:hypothetical protein
MSVLSGCNDFSSASESESRVNVIYTAFRKALKYEVKSLSKPEIPPCVLLIYGGLFILSFTIKFFD